MRNILLKEDIASYKLFVRCFTYNHESFILDALNGFTEQITDFPYACVVIDDNSKDLTAKQIRSFIEDNCTDIITIENKLYELVVASHKSNTHCHIYVYFLKENLFKRRKEKFSLIQPWREQCQYESICEGDDYWTDPYKLQKQFDILEKNSDVSFVYTGFESVDEDGTRKERPFLNKYQDHSHSGNVFFDLLVNLNFILTVTTTIRTSCIRDIPIEYYDYGIFLLCARQGKARYLPEKTSCYRYNHNSITNTNKDSLLPLFYFIVYNEIREAIVNSTTASFIKNDPKYRTILGYVIARNIRKSTERKNFLNLIFKHPIFIVYTIKGLFIKLFCEHTIRDYVNSL